MTQSGQILVVAATFLIISIFSVALGLRRTWVGRRHALLAFGWLCTALAVTLVIFSFFPQSQAQGAVLGISVGGAAAFVVVIWLVGIRVQRQMWALDKSELLLQEREEQIIQLTRELETLRQHHAPQSLQTQRVYHYDISDRLGEKIGIVTGDLQNVDFVDIWVNSENVDMQMSRFHEKSVSGLIRYEGAERDVTGQVIHDRVADELARKVNDHAPVTAGTAIATTSGKLLETNHVRHIIHTAAVQGEPGAGYRQVHNVGRCVREALRLADRLGADQPASTIIFPLLGTGAAEADPVVTATTLTSAAVDYLVANGSTTIRTVFFLAYTDRELSACREALQALGLHLSRTSDRPRSAP